MCLDVVHSEKPEPTGVGYKVFSKWGRFLYGDFTSGTRRTKTWLVAELRKRYGSAEYALGFHIFETLSGAKGWIGGLEGGDVVRRVKYQKAHTQGIQSGHSVIVADGIYIYPGEVR